MRQPVRTTASSPSISLWLVAICIGMIIGACAMRKPMYTTDEPITAVAPDVHARIEQLQAAIILQQSQAGWDNEPNTSPLFPMDAALPMAGQAGQQACPGAQHQAPRCSKMCELASSICHNADEICKLADEVGANLGRDEWAKQKCGNAAISCQQGQMRCCGCAGSQASGSDGPPY